MRDVAIGISLGFFVALQLGPMSLFLIRSTLRSGVQVGLAIGAGVACIDAAYAALGAAGAAPLLTIDALRIGLGIAGAVVLLAIGIRTLHSAFRVRAGLETAAEVASPRRAFLTSVAGTASNPLTIASWAAVFAAAQTGANASPVPMVTGVGIGSLAWMSVLAGIVAVTRRAAGPRIIRIADVLAGLGMIAFAGLLGVRTVHAAIPAPAEPAGSPAVP
ncbi:LysE family transporter [Flindersiella endophytica]